MTVANDDDITVAEETNLEMTHEQPQAVTVSDSSSQSMPDPEETKEEITAIAEETDHQRLSLSVDTISGATRPTRINRQATDATETNTESETLQFSESKDSMEPIVEVKPQQGPFEIMPRSDFYETVAHVEGEVKMEEHDDDHHLESITMAGNRTSEEPTASLPAGSFGIPIPDSNSDEFVNHGLAFWERARKEWLGPRSDTDSSNTRTVAVPVDVDEIIDVLFATPKQIRDHGGPRKFPQPVALPQMIDLLTDLWEAEGLDT